MGGRARISEITQFLSKAYRAIDVRVAAVREGDMWVDGLVVIRLTYEEVFLVEQRFRELERKHPPVATANFRIILAARPFSDWETICLECQSGLLRIGDLEIHLRQPIEVLELASEIRPDSWGSRPIDGIPWSGVFASVGASNPRMGEDALVREVGRLGYSFPLEAVNELCQVSVTHGQNPGQAFYISAPVLARIDDVRFHRFDKKLEVKMRKHSDISGLSVTIALRGTYFGMEESSSYRKQLLHFELVENGLPIQVLQTSAIDLPEIPLDMWVEVKLVHSDLAEIQQIMQQAQNLIAPIERNVLFEALKHFCPEVELTQLLANPQSRKPVKLKTSAAFELHIAWLLGLCGLSTVVLGEYEHIIAPETNILRGSTDILASVAKSDALLLVACTMGPPKDDDFSNLLNVRGILQREVFDKASIRILPVIFTGAHSQPPHRAIENQLGGIPIVDAERIEILLSLIRDGLEKRFFEFLGNPNNPMRPEII